MNPDSRTARLGYVAPAILVVVALFQVFQVMTNDQSSWSGAGFGMFATLDNESTRAVRAHVEVDGESQVLAPPALLADRAYRVAVLPTEGRIRRLARAWSGHVGGEWSSLRVEVWSIAFDAGSGQLSKRVLRSVELPR